MSSAAVGLIHYIGDADNEGPFGEDAEPRRQGASIWTQKKGHLLVLHRWTVSSKQDGHAKQCTTRSSSWKENAHSCAHQRWR